MSGPAEPPGNSSRISTGATEAGGGVGRFVSKAKKQRLLDRGLYAERNVVERFFCKEFTRIATTKSRATFSTCPPWPVMF